MKVKASKIGWVVETREAIHIVPFNLTPKVPRNADPDHPRVQQAVKQQLHHRATHTLYRRCK
jgi:hypothetical protein